MGKVNTEKEAIFLEAIRSGQINVSATGRVLLGQKPIGTHGNGRGYVLARMTVDKKRWSIMYHRLVWLALVGPIPEGKEINHVDANKFNNAISNLELVTRAENIQHAYDNDLRPRPKSQITREAVLEAWATYQKSGPRYAADELGVSTAYLYTLLRRENLRGSRLESTF